MDDKRASVRALFKHGDYVVGIGGFHCGCSDVFEGPSGELQPFDYLNDYDPSHFRLATEEEKDAVIKFMGEIC